MRQRVSRFWIMPGRGRWGFGPLPTSVCLLGPHSFHLSQSFVVRLGSENSMRGRGHTTGGETTANFSKNVLVKIFWRTIPSKYQKSPNGETSTLKSGQKCYRKFEIARARIIKTMRTWSMASRALRNTMHWVLEAPPIRKSFNNWLTCSAKQRREGREGMHAYVQNMQPQRYTYKQDLETALQKIVEWKIE